MTLEEIAERLKNVSETPRLDARLLMAHAKGNLEDLIERRLKHEPVSKIIGRRGFWKTEFTTSKGVLDPRPDTEVLIEAVLQAYPEKMAPWHILDIGVGSGCILYSLLDEYPQATGVGIDISDDALSIAQQNRQSRKADLYHRDFMESNWTTGLGTFDIVVSNPPYIPTGEIESLSPDVRNYDPLSALDGGADGLDAYRTLAKNIPFLLNPNGSVFLEIGIGQTKRVIDLFVQNGFIHKETRRDYGGIERVVSFQHPKK